MRNGVELVVGVDRSVMQHRGDRRLVRPRTTFGPGPTTRSRWTGATSGGSPFALATSGRLRQRRGWSTTRRSTGPACTMAGRPARRFDRMYELHVGTFTPRGTFDGAIERSIISSSSGHASSSCPSTPSPASMDGATTASCCTPRTSRTAVRTASRLRGRGPARGIGVLLDVVYNHFGPRATLGAFGPYSTDRHQTPWGDAVNLDGPTAAVRRFFIDNACHWLRGLPPRRPPSRRRPCAGGRLRAALPHRVDRNGRRPGSITPPIPGSSSPNTRTPSRWRCVHERPAATGSKRCGATKYTTPCMPLPTGERHGYDAPFGSMAAVAEALTGPKDDLPRSRFVACTQNHDQVGNRARGERLVELAGIDGARTAIVLVLCGPFTPMLFMGEEWAARRRSPTSAARVTPASTMPCAGGGATSSRGSDGIRRPSPTPSPARPSSRPCSGGPRSTAATRRDARLVPRAAAVAPRAPRVGRSSSGLGVGRRRRSVPHVDDEPFLALGRREPLPRRARRRDGSR